MTDQIEKVKNYRAAKNCHLAQVIAERFRMARQQNGELDKMTLSIAPDSFESATGLNPEGIGCGSLLSLIYEDLLFTFKFVRIFEPPLTNNIYYMKFEELLAGRIDKSKSEELLDNWIDGND